MFTVGKHEYMNIIPPLNDLPRPLTYKARPQKHSGCFLLIFPIFLPMFILKVQLVDAIRFSDIFDVSYQPHRVIIFLFYVKETSCKRVCARKKQNNLRHELLVETICGARMHNLALIRETDVSRFSLDVLMKVSYF